MEHTVTTKKWYVVSGTAGDTVTSPDGSKIFCTVPEGGQGIFYATSPIVVTSNDSVEVVETTFNLAPVKLKLLGLLGGGVSNGLPSGYLAAEFLESTGTQYIKTQASYTGEGVLQTEFMLPSVYGQHCVWGARKSDYTEAFYLIARNNKDILGAPCSPASFSAPLANHKYKVVVDYANFKVDGEIAKNTGGINTYSPYIYLFAYNAAGNAQNKDGLRLFYFDSTITSPHLKMLPALDSNGVPCMFDKVSNQPFYNSGTGSFIVGMTLKQARKLGKLPAGGGTLKVSLPSNYLEEEGVTNAIAAANAKGWNIEVASTFESDGASATFALRRIWVRKTQDEQGNYINADGVRWQVESCVAMYNADGSEPDAHGYEPFRSVEVATEYWGLTPWVDPEQEELLTNTENE
jgi:hypothetical protein